jgi:hypothetical protein
MRVGVQQDAEPVGEAAVRVRLGGGGNQVQARAVAELTDGAGEGPAAAEEVVEPAEERWEVLAAGESQRVGRPRERPAGHGGEHRYVGEHADPVEQVDRPQLEGAGPVAAPGQGQGDGPERPARVGGRNARGKVFGHVTDPLRQLAARDLTNNYRFWRLLHFLRRPNILQWGLG